VLGWSGAWLQAIGIKRIFPWMVSIGSLMMMLLTQSPEATIVAVLAFLVVVFWKYQTPEILIWLGSISYSLYLLHVPIGGKIMNLAGRYESHGWVIPMALALALSASLLAAWSYWRWIEMPFHELSRRMFRSR
jgi:peptidoglycan/LPS O-acetylase OafA/YrhL